MTSNSDLLIPGHIAFIMDGNGRWAKQSGKLRSFGHDMGADNLRRVMEYCADFGVRIITAYVLSTENWNRPKSELDFLMRLIRRKGPNLIEELNELGVRVLHAGSRKGVSSDVLKIIDDGVERTKDNTDHVAVIAFNYGGRQEMLDATARIMADGRDPDEITEELFRSYLYCGDLPYPDVLVRTGGEKRLSNFLLWQTANSVFYTTEVPWPEFGKEELLEAIQLYTEIKRVETAA